MKLLLALVALVSLSHSAFSQIVVGKKVESSTSYSHIIYPSQDGGWNRTVFAFPKKGNQAPQLIYGYSDKEGILRLILPSTLKFNESYVDYDGQFIPAVVDSLSEFKEDLAQVTDIKSGKVGFVNRSGKLIVPTMYSFAGRFSNGLAYVADMYCEGTNMISYIKNDGETQFSLRDKYTKLYMCCYFRGEPFNGKTIEMNINEFGHDCNCNVKLILNKEGEVLSHEGELFDADYNKLTID